MQARRDRYLSLLLLSPSIIAIAIFVYGFIGWTLRTSLSQWQGLVPDFTWAGLTQYLKLFGDQRFHIDIRNTVIFTVLFLIACLFVGLLLAILLDQRLRGETFFRNLFLFPMSISFIVTGVVWRWLMNPASGSRTSGLNLLFQSIGLDFLTNKWYLAKLPHLLPPAWLPNADFLHTPLNIGIAAIVIPAVWQMSGFTMALYLAGLRAIPEELREAARVDGANELQIYRNVILPLLRPITLSAVIILGHISLKVFDLIVVVSGESIALDVPSIYMWRTTFRANQYAQGAAIAILMLIAVAVLVVPYLVNSMRQESEL